MNNDIFAQWLTMGKQAAEPMMKLNELSTRTMEQVVRQQMGVAQDYVDLGARQLQLMGSVQDPRQWIAAQGELAGQFSQKLTGRAESFMQLAGDTRQEMTSWAESNAERMKETLAAKAA